MHTLTAADPETRSVDIVGENLQKLRELFPEAFTEARVDFDVLRQLLGDAVDEREEKFGLNWHGKRRARQMALTPSTGTLRPCPEQSVDWDTTGNMIIEGDNLEVLRLMQKSYNGQVKLIYIDPPYNTGNDFVYPDDFRDNIRNYLEITGQTDDTGRRVKSNTEASGRYHTEWLSMMYPRMKLARNLLKSDGVLFVSIDDGEVHNLRFLLNEIYGEENFVAHIVWQKRYVSNATAMHISDMHDHILVFARDISSLQFGLLHRTDEQLKDYKNPDNDVRGPWRPQDLSASKPYQAGLFEITGPTGLKFSPPPGRYWRCNFETYERWLADDRITFGRSGVGRPMLKAFLSETQGGIKPNTWWDHTFAGHNKEATLEIKALFDGESPFDTPKPSKLIKRMLHLVDDPNALVLDFFAGSGTTAHAVLQANHEDGGSRRFVLVQFPEDTGRTDYNTIHSIAVERVRRVANQLEQQASRDRSDLGFRVFKLDSSNIRTWEPDRDNIEHTLDTSIEHLKAGRTEQDVLYELLLKMGLDLAVPTDTREIARKTVYSVGAGTLMVCLAQTIARDEAEPLALGIAAWQGELAPEGDSHAVFRDSAFADDVAKTNLTAILHQHGIAHVRSI